MQLTTTMTNLLKSQQQKSEGVSLINIYLLRLVFMLTFLFVGYDSWSAIFTHAGPWKPMHAVAVSVWAAYSTLSLLGLFHPLKLLPLVAFQISYKVIWLTIVALPLWTADALAGSDAAAMTKAFLWVVLPITAMPWRYFFRQWF